MIKLTFLGTASAVANQTHQNSHFILETGDRTIMVDCVGSPITRLDQAGIDPLKITDLILTHFHPDHVSGVPLLLMDLWLMGRKKPLAIYGLAQVIDQVKGLMALFNWQTWDGFYDVQFIPLPSEKALLVLEDQALTIHAALLCHMVPSIGIKFQAPEGVITYSSDTSPCDALVQLAKGSDILIHEATGEGKGHSSPEEAGIMADKAGVGTLYMIHYPPECDPDEWVTRAKKHFSGRGVMAQDLMTIVLL